MVGLALLTPAAGAGKNGLMTLAARPAVRRRWRAFAYLGLEALWCIPSLLYLVAALLAGALLLLGVGWLVVPQLVSLLSALSGGARERAAKFARATVPARIASNYEGLSFRERVELLRSPAVRRDASWLVLHALVMPVVALIGVALPISALNNTLGFSYWWLVPMNDPLLLPFPVTSWPLAFAALGVAVLYLLIAWAVLPMLARRTAQTTLGLLWPERYTEMEERIESLSRSRAAALDAHSSELRRIERELHDGAQNRLVGVVMMLGLAERAAAENPSQVPDYIGQAKDAATDALTGLRRMVHDIYPPVLDELGLSGAASTLTSRSAIPCTLDVSELRRAPAAVEAAAYFVLAEALSNAAKYADASRISVTLRTESTLPEDTLIVQVDDDGRGGAVVGVSGTGLAGVARRAEALGGALDLTSPLGGPTRVRVELPCGF